MPFPVFFLTTYIRTKMSILKISINKNIFGGKFFFRRGRRRVDNPAVFSTEDVVAVEAKVKAPKGFCHTFSDARLCPQHPRALDREGEREGENVREREREKGERNI